MARRIDYYDDPSAPEANSLVPSVNVVVTNSAGEMLLIRRSDNDNLGGRQRPDGPVMTTYTELPGRIPSRFTVSPSF